MRSVDAARVLVTGMLGLGLLVGCGSKQEQAAGKQPVGTARSAAGVCPDGQEPDALRGCQDCAPGSSSTGDLCTPCDRGYHADGPALPGLP